MCVSNRQDRKSRISLLIANTSLVIGLLLQQFAHPAGQLERNTLHAVCGFLLGLSIVINLLMHRRARSCRTIDS
jgi:hypothetical protein